MGSSLISVVKKVSIFFLPPVAVLIGQFSGQKNKVYLKRGTFSGLVLVAKNLGLLL
jgi:hypothetical protein